MALYEYRCRTCDATFELRRPMAEANAPAACPAGHPGAVRLLSAFAAVGGASTSGSVSAGAAERSPGASCGAHCVCHPG